MQILSDNVIFYTKNVIQFESNDSDVRKDQHVTLVTLTSLKFMYDILIRIYQYM